MQFDSLSIGDYSYNIFFKISDAEVKDGKLVIGYGEKILAEQIDEMCGGNANNNAVGMSRLGKKVTFYNVSGDDDYWRLMKMELIKEGVDTSSLVDLPQHRSNLAGTINFQGEKTQIIYHDPHEYQVTDKLPVTPYLYLSSVGMAYEKFFVDLCEFVKKNSVKLCFNPASHQFKKPLSTYENIFRSAHILFMNKEEAALMLGQTEQLNAAIATLNGQSTNPQLQTVIKDLAAKYKAYGSQYVVITDGPFGSYSFDGEKHRYIDIWKDFSIVERTGCGDAYASAFMVAIMNGTNTQEAMRWGTFNGGSKVTKIGPQAGLLHLTEMEDFLKKSPDFQSIEI